MNGLGSERVKTSVFSQWIAVKADQRAADGKPIPVSMKHCSEAARLQLVLEVCLLLSEVSLAPGFQSPRVLGFGVGFCVFFVRGT